MNARYAVALLAVAMAAVLRGLLAPWLDPHAPFITLYGAVALAVWFGGAGPGVLTALLGFVAMAVLFQEGEGLFAAWNARDGVLIASYAFSTGLIIAFGHAMLRARRQCEAEIEERRLAQAAVLAERRRLEITLRSIGDGVLVCDAQGRVITLNPVAQRLTGWSEEAARGQLLPTVFDIVNESTGAVVDNPALRALQKGTTVGLANHTVLRPREGAPCAIEDSAAPIMGDNGEPVGAVLVFRDASVQRDAERRKDEFIATLAHELRNPLAPLRNGVHLLRMLLAPEAGESSEKLAAIGKPLAIMERQIAHMVRLIDDLLDVARISGDKLQLQRHRIDVADAVHQAIETSLPPIEAAGHELGVALPPQPVYVDADVMRLCQVIANLLNNAAKYTPPGGRIGVSVTSKGASVEIAVEDNGRGLTPDMQLKIFQMFAQVDRTQDRSADGLGIGLALARKLVLLHGGELRASSAGLGQGSLFVVTLPRAEVAAPAATSIAGIDGAA